MLSSVCKKWVPGELAKLSSGFPSKELSYSCKTNEGPGPPKHSQLQAVAPGLSPAFVGQSS